MSSMSAQSEWNLNQMFGFATSVQFKKAVEQKSALQSPSWAPSQSISQTEWIPKINLVWKQKFQLATYVIPTPWPHLGEPKPSSQAATLHFPFSKWQRPDTGERRPIHAFHRAKCPPYLLWRGPPCQIRILPRESTLLTLVWDLYLLGRQRLHLFDYFNFCYIAFFHFTLIR